MTPVGVFVSKHANHNIVLEVEEIEWSKGPNNREIRRIKKQPLEVKFKNDWWMLTEYERLYALQVFSGRAQRDENGNVVMTVGRLMPSAAVASPGAELRVTEDGIAEYTVGDRPEHHLGVWYPEHITNEKERNRIIGLLVAQPEYGMSFIYVEPLKLPKPWPKYDNMKLAEVIKFASDGGMDWKVLIAYENSNQERKEFIDAFNEKINADIIEAQENAALSTTA
jgi:hypothetical protein